MKTRKASKIFQEIRKKIESGELADRARQLAMLPKKIEPIVLYCANLDCDRDDGRELTPSEFVDWLYDEGPACPDCGEEFCAKNLIVRCANCDADIDFLDLNHLADILGDTCPECAGRYGITGFRQIHVHGSWSEAWYAYEWTEKRMSAEEISRKGRSDYWEAIVHFCTAEEFISIYRDRKIEASKTGLYGKPAVCLTEATRPNWGEIKARHGEYGFIFRKSDIIAVDGAPAIYLPQTVVDKIASAGEVIPETLKPYVNKITLPRLHKERTRHDYLHEREWRTPGDISFDGDGGVRPYAITFPKRRPAIRDENLILDAAREFQELTEE